MIIVLGKIMAAPGEADRLQGAMAIIMAETAKEDGCVQYVFSRAVNDPDRIIISEIWRDQAALDAHFKTPHMAAFNQAISGANLLGVSVKAYDATGERQLVGSD